MTTRWQSRVWVAAALFVACAARAQETRPYADAQGVEGVVQVLLDRGDAQRAVEQALILVDKQPESGTAHFLLARAYLLQAEQLDGSSALSRSASGLMRRDAEAALGRAIELGCTEEQVFVLRADLLEQRGEIEQAMAVVDRGLVQVATSTDLLVRRAVLLSKKGEHERALMAVQSAVATSADHFDARFVLARELELLGREADALATMRDLAKRHGDRDDLCYLLWELHGQQGKFARAVVCYKAITEELPASAWAWLYLGAAERRANQLADAEKHLVHAAELDPGAVEIENELGSLRQVQGKLDEAARLFAKVAHQPSSYQEQAQERVLQLAGALAKSLKFEQAIELFDELLKIDPRNYYAAMNRALALRQAGRVPEAEAAYRQAITDFPNDRQLTNDLALLLLGVGRRDAARELFLVAEQLGGMDATENLAMLDLAQGAESEAEARLVKVLERDPTRARALVALERARRAR